jgi:pimeloyl-ACP methyl ester carboxylesterase
MRISPFHIDIPESEIQDLVSRIQKTRWPDEAPRADWSYGADLSYLKELVSYWEHGFDWRAQEERLNEMPNFLCRLKSGGEELDVHFVRHKGRGPAPLPLILSHGWPGCFAELLQLVPLLTDPVAHGAEEKDAFDVVIPSLPGFGFSDAPQRPDFEVDRIGSLWVDLMSALGYEKFGAHGGDWGAHVSLRLGRNHPERLIGIHVNYIPGAWRPYIGPGEQPLSEEELASIRYRERWEADFGGYARIQSTRPQTLAYALQDSPVGLAAWILDLFYFCSGCNANIEETFSKDDLLTVISLYWFTKTIGTSMRLYREVRNSPPLSWEPEARIKVPCGIIRFPAEIALQPRELAERFMNVVHWKVMPKGGHFAAIEQPEALVADIREFFRPLRT